MGIQILIVGLFAFNMALYWLTVMLTKKFGWYRVPSYVIFALLPLLTVFLKQPHFELDYFWWKVAGIVAMVLGAAIASWAKYTFWKAGMWSFDLPKELITSGPYQFVRHPHYLGGIFIWVGWWWVWAAVYSFYYGMFILVLTWIQAYLEEKLILEKQFGDQFVEYRRQTGMFWIK